MAVAPISGFHAAGLSTECKQRDLSTKPVWRTQAGRICARKPQIYSSLLAR